MEKIIAEGIKIAHKEGKLILTVEQKNLDAVISFDALAALEPVLEDLQEKINAGEIDLVKGTDMDAKALNLGLEMILKALRK